MKKIISFTLSVIILLSGCKAGKTPSNEPDFEEEIAKIGQEELNGEWYNNDSQEDEDEHYYNYNSEHNLNELPPKTIKYTDGTGPHYLADRENFINYIWYGTVTNPHTYPAFMYGSFNEYIFFISSEFIEFVGRDKFENWINDPKWKYEQNNYYSDEYKGYPDFGKKDGERPIIPTSLSDSCNLFSFVKDFNIPKETISRLIEENNQKNIEIYNGQAGHANEFLYYFFAPELIEALGNKDEELLLELLLTSEWYPTIIKEKNYYSSGWLFFAEPEEYISAGITLEELLLILETCRNTYQFSEISKIALEQKIYDFLILTDETFDNKEIFGYDLDNNMPIPYEHLIHSYFDYHHYYFYSDYFYAESTVGIKKDDMTYTLAWIYYNTCEAYREVGITPNELIEMLPNYKALAVLSDEAMAALEDKIYRYRDNL